MANYEIYEYVCCFYLCTLFMLIEFINTSATET